MSLGETLIGVNSRALDIPLNHLIWLQDYKTFGEDSYVFRRKDILDELYNSVKISANDSRIYIEAFRHIVDTSSPKIGIYFGAINGIGQGVEWQSLTTLDTVLASETAMNAIFANETAMNAMFASETAMNGILASEAAMNAVLANETVMNILFASETAMNKILASETAMNAIFANETAMNALRNVGVKKTVTCANGSTANIEKTVLAGTEHVIYFVDTLYVTSQSGYPGGGGTVGVIGDNESTYTSYDFSVEYGSTVTKNIHKLCKSLRYKSNVGGVNPNKCAQYINYYELSFA